MLYGNASIRHQRDETVPQLPGRPLAWIKAAPLRAAAALPATGLCRCATARRGAPGGSRSDVDHRCDSRPLDTAMRPTSSPLDFPSRGHRVKGALRTSLPRSAFADPGPGIRSTGAGSYEEDGGIGERPSMRVSALPAGVTGRCLHRSADDRVSGQASRTAIRRSAAATLPGASCQTWCPAPGTTVRCASGNTAAVD